MHKFFAKTLFLGKKVCYLPECHSTNEEAHHIISLEKPIEGLVVVTDRQTKGKGQRGNIWESEPGKNLTFSTVLKPSFIKIPDQFGLHLLSSLAIHDALFSILGNKLSIKWPNDIYYEDNKLGGILIENSIRGNGIEYSIIGIGININQLVFETPHATSLADIGLQDYNIMEVAENILANLEKRYLLLKKSHFTLLLNEYHARMYKYGQNQLFSENGVVFTGTIRGVEKTGKIIIESDGNMLKFDFKEIEFLRD
ncbi:MAG: biotin--[acetyl-CoA-carboxylase] ligase [Cyclobacteriaceae bacterium]